MPMRCGGLDIVACSFYSGGRAKRLASTASIESIAKRDYPLRGRRSTGADPGRGEAECAMVERLRLRPGCQRPMLPDTEHCPRRHHAVTERDPGHLDLRPPRGTRPDGDLRAARQTGTDRQRLRLGVHMQRQARLGAATTARTRPGNPFRTASWRASTAACATSFSTRR